MIPTPVSKERAHLLAWELLPWLVNGTAGEFDRSHAEQHLRDCESCRDELARQRGIHLQMNVDTSAEPPVERGVARLLQRIDQLEQPAAQVVADARRAPRRRWAVVSYSLAALVVLEATGLAVLSSPLGGSPPAAEYRTLSTPDSSTGFATIRLVLEPAMQVGQIQSLLVPLHLQIVAGPSENGVYSLGPASTPGDVERQVSALRAARGVRFVEPVAGHDAR